MERYGLLKKFVRFERVSEAGIKKAD
jgi:hypothetical protein